MAGHGTGHGWTWHRDLWNGHSTAQGQEEMGDTQNNQSERKKNLKEAGQILSLDKIKLIINT